MKRSLRSWLWSVPLEQEVDDELAFHREMRERDQRPANIDSGVRDTLLTIGRKRDRKMRLLQWLEEFRTDVAFALRQMRRAPAFTVVAVLTLAIGIGANSAMFALVDAAFIRPLPFQSPPDRLFMLWDRAANGARLLASPLDYLDWGEQNRSFVTMAAMTVGSGMMTLGDDPTPIATRSVTFRFFEVLGVTPIAGRTFATADTVAPSTVVIGEAFWRRRFGADASAVGQTLVFGGQPLTIVGIVPATFQFAPPGGGDASAGPTDAWLLFNPPRAGPPYLRASHFIWVIGRLRDGVSTDAARQDLAALARHQGERFPSTHANRQIDMEALREALIGREVRTTSLLLLGVVGFVLLVCCANVASLVLAQSRARAGEIAVRCALGAGRRRIVTQLLTEGLVLAMLGAIAGATLGAVILRGTPAVIPAGLLPNAVTLAFDERVVAFCAGSALLVAIAFGLGPAWQTTRVPLVESLAQNTRMTRRGGLGNVLVAGQIAVTVLVLCGAGLLLRTLLTLGGENPGFTANDAVTLVVNLPFPNQTARPEARGPYGTEGGIQHFFDRVRDEVSRVPGVRQVAWGGAMPLDGYWTTQPFEISGDPPRDVQDRNLASYHMVSAGYFATLGIPVLAGRTFADADIRTGRPVCIVTDAFVQRYLQGRSPIGQRVVVSRMAFAAEPPAEREIVGVVRQVISLPGERNPIPHVYIPQTQNAWWSATLVVKPAGVAAEALIPGIRDAFARVDRGIRPTRIRTMDDITRASTARPRFRALLVGAFALLALGLASVGVFGLLTQTVQEKTRELAVRVALGARGSDIIRIVGSGTARVAIAGAGIGLVLAAMFTRWLTTMLYGVSPLDPLTFAMVLAVLAGTAVAAASAPTRRALRIEPAAAFRQE